MSMDITLYSGPDYTGESFVVPPDGETYSLAATGLKTIGSIKVPKHPMRSHSFQVRLHLERPTSKWHHSDSSVRDFKADVADTAEFAGAGWLSASAVSSVGQVGNSMLGDTTEFTIHDTIKS
ncbi:hypothetical protein [Kitasatospora purpeofusca]|uniref:Beta/gamma crystallin 'Greek key' domain-containing protein n=1 Tax=Kitasatospora purpeofusca TaxID=67352 RepID=A0ABZ1U8E6_9ACTN|nr:hypothetical protein [Kitasatospora purpeofusca]